MASVNKYMSFDLTERAAQGMSVWNDHAFILYDGGTCSVYDLRKKTAAPIATFPLASENPGIPSKEYRNHANSCMFGSTHWNGNSIPLLYITTGSGTGYDNNGYFYRCSIENITCTESDTGTLSYQSEVIQTITFHPDGIDKTEFSPPAWGCPCFLTDNKYLYIFSARYRTKHGCVPEGESNAFMITKFPLPPLDAGTLIKLTPKDIIEQFTVESNTLFTQGGMIHENYLYYTFGYPKGGYPVKLMVFDLNNHTLVWETDPMDDGFHGEEIECCSIYQGQLLCNTTTGSIYQVDTPFDK